MKNQLVKKITGVLLILAGLLILLTPLTPGSWIIFIGFELLGIRMTFWKKLILNTKLPISKNTTVVVTNQKKTQESQKLVNLLENTQ